jgi:hypothetical protein
MPRVLADHEQAIGAHQVDLLLDRLAGQAHGGAD